MGIVGELLADRINIFYFFSIVLGNQVNFYRTGISVMIFCAMVLVSCSVSPGRKILAKGSIEPDVSVSMFLSAAEHGLPVIPNIEAGLRYGLTNRVTIGSSWAFVPIITETVLFIGNPFVVGQVLPPRDIWPSINLYFALPVLISFKERELRAFPLLGAVIRKEWGRMGAYPMVEFSFDKDTFEDKIDLHTNARLGVDWTSKKKTAFTLEGGLDNIGQRNVLGKLTYGFPCIHISMSHNFHKKQKTDAQ